jgi:hypothetical protein
MLLLKHWVPAFHTSTQLLSFMQHKTGIHLTMRVFKQGIAQDLLVHKPHTGHQTKAFLGKRETRQFDISDSSKLTVLGPLLSTF